MIKDYRAADGSGNPIAALEHYAHYYPFGMQHTGRNGNKYRFGFNGQEKDDEIYGTGNSYTAEFWQYDARLGRRWNVDPVNKPHESSYAAFANNPVWFVDPVGLDTVEISSEKGEIENHIKTEEGDDVFFIMEDGERKKSKKFDDGFIENIDEDILDNDGDVYRLRGDDDSKELFEFYADNIEIEFSLTRTGKEGIEGLNFITTSHQKGKEKGFTRLFNKQLRHDYTIREHIHNHPSIYSPKPSGGRPRIKYGKYQAAGDWGDVGVAKFVRDYYTKKYSRANKPVFKVYSPRDGSYREYDGRTRTLEPMPSVPPTPIR